MTTARLPQLRVPLPMAADAPRAEWLVTNGIGGYASGLVAGEATRRYHGLLVAAFPNPLGRMVMLTGMPESIDDGQIADFRLDGGVPVWRYRVGDAEIEKRIVMPHRENAVVVRYALVGGDRFTLRLTPVVDFRHHEEPVSDAVREDYDFAAEAGGYTLSTAGLPALRFRVEGDHRFVLDRVARDQVVYAMEEARGYRSRGMLWSPGAFEIALTNRAIASIVAFTDDSTTARAYSAEDAVAADVARRLRLVTALPAHLRDDIGAQLALAADQFVITPVGRQHDPGTGATADEERTVIAGYHWFTDWGRDTMISLEGLTLTTGRHGEAERILRTFAHYVRDGLIPNMFPNGSDEGLYHTADATLWFFHALHRHATVTSSTSVIADVLPVLRRIIEAHVRGTRYGIGMDTDGLLRQGAEGYQLTWMDAKVDGWVVTPRRGKAVEINALWYNAICLMSQWEARLGERSEASRLAVLAERIHDAFNARFWNEETGHLFDVVDGPEGDDPACRPNQVFAISLPNPVLDASRWGSVLAAVETKLLAPVGLRSLAPDHPDYKKNYHGDLRTRDAAYHQGTVWGWLIGPWIDAWLRVHPDRPADARRFLDGLVAHLPQFGVGSIAEIFDAEPPYTPRGCIAQAWSVAEALRCYALTARSSRA